MWQPPIKLANTQNLIYYYPVIILGPQILSHGFAARACDKSILSKHQQLQSEIDSYGNILCCKNKMEGAYNNQSAHLWFCKTCDRWMWKDHYFIAPKKERITIFLVILSHSNFIDIPEIMEYQNGLILWCMDDPLYLLLWWLCILVFWWSLLLVTNNISMLNLALFIIRLIQVLPRQRIAEHWMDLKKLVIHWKLC